MQSWFSDEVSDLIRKLTNPDPKERLGCGKNGYNDIKNHEFFVGIDWKEMLKGNIKPPYKPKIKDENDISQFDKAFTREPI